MSKQKHYSVDVYKWLMIYKLKKTPEDPNKKLHLKQIIVQEYHKFPCLFLEVVVPALPLHCPYNHKITLKETFTISFGPLYSLCKTNSKTSVIWFRKAEPRDWYERHGYRMGHQYYLSKNWMEAFGCMLTTDSKKREHLKTATRYR